ncbi:MAG: hypothetical protein OES38_18515 [Gammaproteobacteria bacterium]|nr:hypothetical protein [Gammaproteobacteria bacterium]
MPVSESAPQVVADIHHAWITGLVLTLVARKDAAAAEEFVFQLFRRQHLERFLPGLAKLGLDKEPHAVAAAKYHYLSNQLGGVKVEYLEESAHKAWIRYPPPRWMWEGTAICGIPSNVNRAMLRGWHAHNGVTLGNPRLGFVCTKTTVDGQPGLEGYYYEYDRDLEPDERLAFRPEESCPPIAAANLPALDSTDWPADRQAKANRNYAMEYVRNALPLLVSILGPEQARYLGRLCALQIGMHCYDACAAALSVADDSAQSFANLVATLLTASGDEVSVDADGLVQTRWRMFADQEVHPVVRAQWLALFEGMLGVHNRFLNVAGRRTDSGYAMQVTGGAI